MLSLSHTVCVGAAVEIEVGDVVVLQSHPCTTIDPTEKRLSLMARPFDTKTNSSLSVIALKGLDENGTLSVCFATRDAVANDKESNHCTTQADCQYDGCLDGAATEAPHCSGEHDSRDCVTNPETCVCLKRDDSEPSSYAECAARPVANSGCTQVAAADIAPTHGAFYSDVLTEGSLVLSGAVAPTAGMFCPSVGCTQVAATDIAPSYGAFYSDVLNEAMYVSPGAVAPAAGVFCPSVGCTQVAAAAVAPTHGAFYSDVLNAVSLVLPGAVALTAGMFCPLTSSSFVQLNEAFTLEKPNMSPPTLGNVTMVGGLYTCVLLCCTPT